MSPYIPFQNQQNIFQSTNKTSLVPMKKALNNWDKWKQMHVVFKSHLLSNKCFYYFWFASCILHHGTGCMVLNVLCK